jgi:hypothetical protein
MFLESPERSSHSSANPVQMAMVKIGVVFLPIALFGAVAGCTATDDSGPTADDSLLGETSATADALESDLPKARHWIDSPVPLAYTPYVEGANAVREASRSSQIDERTRWWDSSEAFIAQCMQQAGFEYYPSVYSPKEDVNEGAAQYGHPGNVLDNIPWLPETRTEVERVGYGVASAAELQGDEQLKSDYDINASEKTDQYLASLSASATVAYYLALSGLDPETNENKNPGNCQAKAWERYPEPDGPSIEFLAPLDAALRPFAMYISMTGDGAVVTYPPDSPLTGAASTALGRDFAQCVAASKVVAKFELPLGDQSGPDSLFSQAVGLSRDGELFDSGDQWIDASTIADDQRSLVGSAPEREIALLDFDCRVETDYVARYAAIRADFQAAYVAEHQAELDAMMAQIESFLARFSD